MPLSAGPVVRRVRLGAELRRLRHRESLTLVQVCDRLGWASTSKLSRIELGQSRPDLADVLDLLDVYGVPPGQRDELVVIARDAAAGRGWSKALGEMGAAAGVRRAGGGRRPHRRAPTRRGAGAAPDPGVHPAAGDRRGAALRRRGRGGRRTGPRGAPAGVRAAGPALLDERVCEPGGPPTDVWRDQLRHLVALTERPNVTVRLLARDAAPGGVHPLAAFSYYAYPDPMDPRTVLVETLTTDLRLVGAADIDRYERMIDWLLAAGCWLLAAALPADESAELLAGRLGPAAVPRPREPHDAPVPGPR